LFCGPLHKKIVFKQFASITIYGFRDIFRGSDDQKKGSRLNKIGFLSFYDTSLSFVEMLIGFTW